MSLSKSEFLAFAQDYNCIPLSLELLVDMETPVSVLQRFCERRNVFLLESMEGGEKWGRYSFIGLDAEPLMELDHSQGRSGQLESLRDIYNHTRVAPVEDLPRFFGGAVGFVGYEGMLEFEKMPEPKPASKSGPVPVSRFVKTDTVIVFDNVRHTARIVVCAHTGQHPTPEAAYDAAQSRIEEVRAALAAPPAPLPLPDCGPLEFESNMKAEDFIAMVKQAKQYIYDGDIIQAVLSQRFTTEADIHPLLLYRALRHLNPSPYTFFLKIGEQTLVGSSPEVMVRLTDRRVEVRPIAGTRPRGRDQAQDVEFEQDLLADEKERAEHVMLVDLGRNDIGRIAEANSVNVTEYMVIERYSHVMHLVSHVEGLLRKEFDALDVIAATFPAGTLSGAPKIRAMQIIHELEPEPRGAYGGAIGYIGYDGNMDMAITIRTLDVNNGRISVQAGAGIVFDSDPQKEYEETCHKSEGMKKAVEMAANGLSMRKP
jgi:anthranilate synthase component 1